METPRQRVIMFSEREAGTCVLRTSHRREVLTCPGVPAARWASAPPRSLCRGWSHTRRRCSPPWRSPAQAACGGAFLAKSAEGNFEPVSSHRKENREVTRGPRNNAWDSTGLQWGRPFPLLWQRRPRPHLPLTLCVPRPPLQNHLARQPGVYSALG